MSRRKDREECHKARDDFFACINACVSDDQVSEKCIFQKSDFEKKCPPSWVHHFVIQRQVDTNPPPPGGSPL